MGIQTGKLKMNKWGGLKFYPFAPQEMQNWAKMAWGAMDARYPPTHPRPLFHGQINNYRMED